MGIRSLSCASGIGSFGAVILALIIIGMRQSVQLRPSYLWISTNHKD